MSSWLFKKEESKSFFSFSATSWVDLGLVFKDKGGQVHSLSGYRPEKCSLLLKTESEVEEETAASLGRKEVALPSELMWLVKKRPKSTLLKQFVVFLLMFIFLFMGVFLLLIVFVCVVKIV